MIAVTLGEKVVLLRKERKWSQEDLEEYSGISRTQIGRIERDETNPPWTTLRKLETAFDLPYSLVDKPPFIQPNCEMIALSGTETRLIKRTMIRKKCAVIAESCADDPESLCRCYRKWRAIQPDFAN